MTGLDGCPFHDLDPSDEVWIDFGGVVLPYTAERACDHYHLDVALQPAVDAALAAIDRVIAEQGHDEVPPAFRQEQS